MDTGHHDDVDQGRFQSDASENVVELREQQPRDTVDQNRRLDYVQRTNRGYVPYVFPSGGNDARTTVSTNEYTAT